MTNQLELCPNEIFLCLFCYFSWDEILTSFWSLNERLDSLICSIFTRNRYGIILIHPGLSYKQFSSKYFPLIYHSQLSSYIQHIHLDGKNSDSYNLLINNRNILHYPNLKSVILTECYLSEVLIENLSLLIQYRLKELTLKIDEDIFETHDYEQNSFIIISNQIEQRLLMFKEFLRKLFSNQCQLISLRLDTPNYDYRTINFHQCLSSSSNLMNSSSMSHQNLSYCVTLRHLYIRITYGCFLEHLIEHVPNLEQLSVYLRAGWHRNDRSELTFGTLEEPSVTWSDKVKKLTHFIIKCYIDSNDQLFYLKWLFNNLNHVKKVQLYARINNNVFRKNSLITDYTDVDANFIEKYFISDKIINLIHFDFYIISKCKNPSNNEEKILNSFGINSVFVEHQWTNVNYMFDPIKSYQYLSSSNTKISKFFYDFIEYPDILDLPNVKYMKLVFHSRTDRFLERFDEFFPNVSCIKFFMEYDKFFPQPDITLPPLEVEEYQLTNIRLRNVTRLDFGVFFHRRYPKDDKSMNEIKERARTIARVISMPNQLKYLRIRSFRWLLEMIEYASDELRQDALNTVRYAEFYLPSCHRGSNQSIRIGKSLVPFLNTYMPHLQTLHLWKPDDFPWTSIRPDFKRCHHYTLTRRWAKSLETLKSINKHVTVFEQDLFQLVKHLRGFIFLDIRGNIPYEKVEPYRSMVEKIFPNSQIYIDIARFRLWI